MRSLLFSILGHLLVLVLMLLPSSSSKINIDNDYIEVNLVAGVPNAPEVVHAKIEDKKEAPKPKEEAPTVEEKIYDTKEETKPKEEILGLKKKEEKPKEDKKKKDKKKEDKKKEKKKESKIDEIESVLKDLNKDKKSKKKKSEKKEDDKKKKKKKDSLDDIESALKEISDKKEGEERRGVKEGNSEVGSLTANEAAMILHQLEKCWNTPVSGDPKEMIVQVDMKLNIDGSVVQAKVVDADKLTTNQKLAAERALQAVHNPQCTPFILPPEKYDQWKHVIINFDPTNVLS